MIFIIVFKYTCLIPTSIFQTTPTLNLSDPEVVIKMVMSFFSIISNFNEKAGAISDPRSTHARSLFILHSWEFSLSYISSYFAHYILKPTSIAKTQLKGV